jgi:hypothetical protein
MNALIMSRSKCGKTYALKTLLKPLIIQSTDPGGWTTICKKDQVAEPGDWDSIYKILEKTGVCAIDYLKGSNTINASHIASLGYMRYQISTTQFINDCNVIIDSQNDKIASFSHDTLTGLSRMLKGFICNRAGKSYLSQQLWGDAIEKIIEIIENCCASEKHYVLNCHIQLEDNALDGGKEEWPLIFGKQLPQNILALFDLVFTGVYDDGSYLWRTHPSESNKSLGSRLHDGNELETLVAQDFGPFVERSNEKALNSSEEESK